MDFKTINDRPEDPGLDKPMNGPMDPVVPCVEKPTRHCIARWDTDGPASYEVPASTVCPTVCWRNSRKV